MYATKVQLDGVEKKLGEKIDNIYEKIAQTLVKHFYTKDEIDKRFYTKDELDKKFNHVDRRLDGVENGLQAIRIEFEYFRTGDFKQLIECVDGISQKIDVIANEPKAMKLQGEVDELRGRVIRLEKR